MRTHYRKGLLFFMETWKEIELNGINFTVSNYGSILKNGKAINLFIKNGYCAFSFVIKGKTYRYYVHRIVMLAFIGESNLQVNHKNNVKTDNFLGNLEYVTHRENGSHRYKDKEFRGATYDKFSKKWKSQIRINGKSKHLGNYNTPEEAHKAYMNALDTYNIHNKYA
jgi:hypothetical protein